MTIGILHENDFFFSSLRPWRAEKGAKDAENFVDFHFVLTTKFDKVVETQTNVSLRKRKTVANKTKGKPNEAGKKWLKVLFMERILLARPGHQIAWVSNE